MPYARIREAPESSSAATLHAVAAALADAWYQPQPSTPRQAQWARAAARLPRGLIRRLVQRAVRQQALDPALARYISSEGLARQALSAYNRVQNGVGYPAMIVGAANGGAAYLAALLNIPYLPAHFVLSFHDPTAADDIATYQAHGSALIEPIVRRNPDLVAVNHYDPLHDRFLVEEVNHVRLKLLDLPEAYRAFIHAHLAPGGRLFFVNCDFVWEQYQIAAQVFFQVGGLGGYDAEDYRLGNEEIDAWLQSQGSAHRQGWRLEGFPLTQAPESEWGSLPAFRQAVRQFAQDAGYQFHALNGVHPEDFSALAYTAYLWEARLHERTPQGVLIECFSQLNPTAALRSHLLPLWLPFQADDSLHYLARMAAYLPEGLPVLLSLLANFSLTPDTPGATAWKEIAGQRSEVTWIGTDPQRYPADLASRFEYLPALQAWTQAHPGQSGHPARPHLTPEAFLQMMQYLAEDGTKLLEDLIS